MDAVVDTVAEAVVEAAMDAVVEAVVDAHSRTLALPVQLNQLLVRLNNSIKTKNCQRLSDHSWNRSTQKLVHQIYAVFAN